MEPKNWASGIATCSYVILLLPAEADMSQMILTFKACSECMALPGYHLVSAWNIGLSTQCEALGIHFLQHTW